ncbi:ribokinase [Bosea sp. TAF32]|uniref:ribokinase n=1 Tax=Bosea sp. TAF32 TaxID=3237482 RepID=UPI003F92D07C
MILVFGSINVDLVARVATIPGPGKTVLAPSYERHFGGKGANQAVAAARLAAHGRVAMAACVGDDGFGRESIDNLAASGVAVDLVRTGAKPTGCAFITVDARAENAITVASGANLEPGADDVPEALLGADTLLVLQMEVPFAQSLVLARRVRASGGRVVWNCAPVPDGFPAADAAALLAASDVLIVNEHEAADIAAALGHPGGEIAGLIAGTATRCIVTAGAEGAYGYTPEGERLHAAAPRIEPVDTTGAGDTFVGAVAAALDEGLDLQQALDIGCSAAALSCLARGAQAGMPLRSALRWACPDRGQ